MLFQGHDRNRQVWGFSLIPDGFVNDVGIRQATGDRIRSDAFRLSKLERGGYGNRIRLTGKLNGLCKVRLTILPLSVPKVWGFTGLQ
jgi:hypothetical protein